MSLLCTSEKVFEQAIFKHVFNHFRDNSILTSLQSGFIPADSTVNQLTYLYNAFSQALDFGKEVRVVFCDMSKAYDRVWHESLLKKLEAAGISGNPLLLFRSYLSDRRQRVVLVLSRRGNLYELVSTGFYLGPLLFLLFINDIGSNIRVFADDTSLFIIVEHPDTAAELLYLDLEKIWLGQKLGLFRLIPRKISLFLSLVNWINMYIHLSLWTIMLAQK